MAYLPHLWVKLHDMGGATAADLPRGTTGEAFCTFLLVIQNKNSENRYFCQIIETIQEDLEDLKDTESTFEAKITFFIRVILGPPPST